MLVITCATSTEIDSVTRWLIGKRRMKFIGCTAWQGTYKQNEVLALQTGMGRAGVENVLNPILGSQKITGVLSIGFAGALKKDMSVGDVVICTSVVSASEKADSYHADSNLVKCALEAMNGKECKYITGKSVTIPRPACTQEDKQRLKDTFQVDVCEMEDFWIAGIASEKQTPFLAVRAISDELDCKLPEFKGIIDSQGYVKSGKAVSYLLTHPLYINNTLNIYRNFRRAQKSLSLFTASFLDKYFNLAGVK